MTSTHSVDYTTVGSGLGRGPVITMEGVQVWLPDGTTILRAIDWTVNAGEHWALLGPNGSGKSTLLSLASAYRYPSAGAVTILAERIGRTSVWDLRTRIGLVDPNHRLLEWLSVEEIVLTGVTQSVWLQPDRIGAAERRRAADLLDLVGCADLGRRTFASCSHGERQRVRIARALMPAPPLLLLDEPATGLDLPSREALLTAIADLATAHPHLATVFVSHHLEDLPPTTTHVLLLRDGAMAAQGPIATTLTSASISASFGYPVVATSVDGRWTARAAASWKARRERVASSDGHLRDQDA